MMSVMMGSPRFEHAYNPWHIAYRGYGPNPSGESEAWIAYVPEPTTPMLMIIAALLTRRSLHRRVRPL